MKKIIESLLVVLMFVCGTGCSLFKRNISIGGNEQASQKVTYHIKTAKDLLQFAEIVNGQSKDVAANEYANAVLDNDIDMSTICSEELGSWIPIGYGSSRYRGVFDGQNHTIRNLYMIGLTSEGQGLFGNVRDAEIKNIVLGEGYLSSNGVSVGGIVGVATGKIVNCHNYATICSNDKFNGGIVGYMGRNSTIERCHNEGTITSTSSEMSLFGVGGIAGAASAYTVVKDCYNIGIITGASSRVGGIVGSAEDCIIKNCHSYGDVESKRNDYGGGLYGYSYSNTVVENCYYFNKIESSYHQEDMRCQASDFENKKIFKMLYNNSPFGFNLTD